jgi:hypothetical protein
MQTRTHSKSEQLRYGTHKGFYKSWDIYKANNYQGQWWAVSADGTMRINPGSTKRRLVQIIDQHISQADNR